MSKKKLSWLHLPLAVIILILLTSVLTAVGRGDILTLFIKFDNPGGFVEQITNLALFYVITIFLIRDLFESMDYFSGKKDWRTE